MNRPASTPRASRTLNKVHTSLQSRLSACTWPAVLPQCTWVEASQHRSTQQAWPEGVRGACFRTNMYIGPIHLLTSKQHIPGSQNCRFEGARAAYSIIARGPEQIMSQFSISYGMVLNLLSTRSLEDCEHFLARSFLRFQTAGNVEETVAEAQRLESEAERLLQRVEGAGDEALFKKFEAANVRCSEATLACTQPALPGLHNAAEIRSSRRSRCTEEGGGAGPVGVAEKRPQTHKAAGAFCALRGCSELPRSVRFSGIRWRL